MSIHWDSGAGKGASVGKIEKTYEMEIREELASYSTKKEAPVPLWMRDINRQVFETTLDYTKTKSTYHHLHQNLRSIFAILVALPAPSIFFYVSSSSTFEIN